MRYRRFPQLTLGFLAIIALLAMLSPRSAQAGVYDADDEVTYIEYWVPHSVFTGGFLTDVNGILNPDCIPAGGNWFLEAWSPCEKSITFNMPHSLADAVKVEIYMDLWRNHVGRSVEFRLNNTQWRRTTVGYDWSRTPWVAEIPVSELVTGNNTMEVRDAAGAFHIHDIAFRIYVPGLAVPDGQLTSVGGSNPAAGGTLMVNSDTLSFAAELTEAATYVEFHGYYDGYDLDNDGKTRDWQNRTRNNWNPGGLPIEAYPGSSDTTYPFDLPPYGGTIDHIGTALSPTSGNTYGVTWDLAHVPNQSGVRFKIRIVKAAGGTSNYVREAAGGASAPFTLMRDRNVHAFFAPNFSDIVLHHSKTSVPQYPDWADRELILPSSLAGYQEAILLGAFWRNPLILLNPTTTPETVAYPCPAPANPRQQYAFQGEDRWTLSKRNVNMAWLQSGLNKIRYIHAECGFFGTFIERPGPVLIMHQNGGDAAAPVLANSTPVDGKTNVPKNVTVLLNVIDDGRGIDFNSLAMTVNGSPVTPTITGFSNGYFVAYQSPQEYDYEQNVTVTLDACDLTGKCMPTQIIRFRIEPLDTTTPGPSDIVSDDFNACTIDPAVWTLIDPQAESPGAATVDTTGTELVLAIPAGTIHDIWAAPASAPRLAQEIQNTNFSIDVGFNSAVDQFIQMQGIVFEEAPNPADGVVRDFLRVNFQHWNQPGTGTDAFETSIFVSATEDGAPRDDTVFYQQVPDGVPQYLRVVRDGINWEVFVSSDRSEWISVRSFTLPLTVARIGLFAGNADPGGLNPTGIPAHSAVVNFITSGDDPIDVLDPINLYPEVASSPTEGGTVENVPALPTEGKPNCGAVRLLTAIPKPGWVFDGWTSDQNSISGMENPITGTVRLGESVVARFVQEGYTLDAQVNNPEAGSVSKSPNQARYVYGDEVTVTAVPSGGWVFSEWQGDVASVENPLTITMTQDLVLEAVFVSEPRYSVDLTRVPAQGGEVTISPESDSGYLPGTEVTIRALPNQADGWSFSGWTGEINRRDNPHRFIMPDRSLAVTANFSQTPAGDYVLSLGVVGFGDIAVEPNNPSYTNGEQVTLTAEAGNGWRFLAWQGDGLTGSTAPVVTITMDDDKTITAVFGLPNFLPIVQR